LIQNARGDEWTHCPHDVLSDLSRRPIVCQLPRHKIEVSGEYVPPSDHYGECAAAGKATLSLYVDGKQITDLDDESLGGCEANRFLVEIDAEGATVCKTNISALVWADKKASTESIQCKVVKSFPVLN